MHPQSRCTRLATRLLLLALSGLLLLLLVQLTTETARAANVNVYDQAGVLNVNQVSQEAAMLPIDIDIYTLNNFSGDADQLADFAKSHFTTSSSGMLVMMIDTVNRHLAIEGNDQASFEHQQYADATNAFAGAIKNASGQDDYTAATLAALKSLEQAASGNSIGTFLGWGVVILIFIVVAYFYRRKGGSSSYSNSSSYTYIDTDSGSSDSSGGDGATGSF